MTQNVLNGILGLVVLVAAFLGLSGATLEWTFAILGALVAVVGFWGATVDSTRELKTI